MKVENAKMRLSILILSLVSLSLVAGNIGAASLARIERSPMPIAFRLSEVESPVKFSSAYTTLGKCGSGLTKKEEKEAEKHGTDIPTRCKGYGGYDIFIGYSACTSHFLLEKGQENIPLAMQAVDWKQKTVEWRMADGKPFAVIMRVFEYAGNEYCATGGTVTGESLIVKGLKGYEHINETVNVKTTPNPNEKARELADKGYARP
jgi:hypothetical protein